LVNLVEQTEIVADMMAGVGPFALPLAKRRRVRVFANDLNPDSCAGHFATVVKVSA
jgi:tRNA (guanine37-N1)-methyltransferase